MLSPPEILEAAARRRALPVDELLQQRCSFRSDRGFEAQLDEGVRSLDAVARDLKAAGGCPGSLSENFKEEGLALRLKVTQAGAALWMPAQQGCDWPVNIMLEVSLYSERAIPEGVHIKLVADAITDAQRVVLAHGGPLPLRLQRLLAPTDKCKASGIRGATMFSAPQDRRVATLAVPKARTWVQEHFIFPSLSFQKHSSMHPMSLMFAATAIAVRGGGAAAAVPPDVAATILLPRTISVQNLTEAHAAVRSLLMRSGIYGTGVLSPSLHRGAGDASPGPAPGGSHPYGNITACAPTHEIPTTNDLSTPAAAMAAGDQTALLNMQPLSGLVRYDSRNALVEMGIINDGTMLARELAIRAAGASGPAYGRTTRADDADGMHGQHPPGRTSSDSRCASGTSSEALNCSERYAHAHALGTRDAAADRDISCPQNRPREAAAVATGAQACPGQLVLPPSLQLCEQMLLELLGDGATATGWA